MRAEGVKGQNTLKQHGFDVSEKQIKCSSQSVQPNTEEIEGPSHSDIGIATEEVLNQEDLLEIQEEPEVVPRSEPDI